MEVRFWGVRGSIAKSGPSVVRYGGNTSCVEVRSNSGTLVVIDCGTGAHGLGIQLMTKEPKPIRGSLLISHTHWDHIQGIPFFAPLFVPGNEWDIYAPSGLGQSLQETLAGQMQYTYFPITLEQLGATIRYHDLVEGSFQIGDIKIQTCYLNHPALTLGYRLEADDVSVVYSCDHEPHAHELASGTGTPSGEDSRHVDFMRGADLVIHDSQYTAAEYGGKVGWGHSTAEYAVLSCKAAGVRKLALTHHDPMRDDDAVDRMVAAAREQAGAALEVFGAQEGPSYKLIWSPRAAGVLGGTAHSALAPAAHGMDRSVLAETSDASLWSMIETVAKADDYQLFGGPGQGGDVIRAAQDRSPSLIVLEDAPTVAPKELARAIRGGTESWSRQVPIIALSKDPAPPDLDKGLIADWLRRPFSQEYLRSRMRAWLMRIALRWRRAEPPNDEDKRLSALRDLAVLDTPAEERFDRITRIAKTMLDVPIALVSLVDKERQWFKSCIGLPVLETHRDMAFCAHAILKPEDLFIVPDTLRDDRFADNPLVTDGPRIRFYVGCPLVLKNGAAIGTLCCIDTRPRAIDQAQQAALKDLAALAVRELEAA